MAIKLFIPQEDFDAWLSAEKVSLEGEILSLLGTNISLRLVPGCHFKGVQAGHDQRGLLGKVKAKAALAALGAEVYLDSVILGETAYEVEAGFVAKPVGAVASDAAVRSAVARL